MNIPTHFKIGGQVFDVKFVDSLENEEYGLFTYTPPLIQIARTTDGHAVPENQMEATFYHELMHAFQYMYNCEIDEAQAQVYSNFIVEYLQTKQ